MINSKLCLQFTFFLVALITASPSLTLAAAANGQQPSSKNSDSIALDITNGNDASTPTLIEQDFAKGILTET